MLYIRMFLIMLVSLYTSRMVLQALGVVDFGIYNVVGGVVSMMGMFNSAMSAGTSRYMNYALGKNDATLLGKTFSVSYAIYGVICIGFIVLAETIGLWFLNTQLLIPLDRVSSANWVYQFTLLAVVTRLMGNPYNSALIAHERMDVFAYISIFEVLLKLSIVFLLMLLSYDHLIAYGILIFISEVIIRLMYRAYCKKNFKECKFKWCSDKSFYKEMIFYSGWNLFGSVSGMVKSQGLNLLLNMFFVPTVNAARGIAYQVNTVINQFCSNFYTAVKPQIIKYYAADDLNNMFKLVFRSSKMSYYLILLISLPVILECPYLIHLWLGQTIDHVVSFTRLIIIVSAIDGMAHPLMTTAHATGKIALYQSLVGTMIIMIVPISYIFLLNGFNPETVFYVSIVVSFLALLARLWVVHRLVKFPVIKYIYQIFGNALIVTIISVIIPIWLTNKLEESFLSAIIICTTSIICTIITIYVIGLTNDERLFLLRLICKKQKTNDQFSKT